MNREEAEIAYGLALYDAVMADLVRHEAHELWEIAAKQLIDAGGRANPVPPCGCNRCARKVQKEA